MHSREKIIPTKIYAVEIKFIILGQEIFMYLIFFGPRFCLELVRSKQAIYSLLSPYSTYTDLHDYVIAKPQSFTFIKLR